MTDLIATWSDDPMEEDGMTDEHAWIWQEMINGISHSDLTSVRVLDIGCNQGGFLRMLYDSKPFASGVGVDIARERVDLANAAKGDRPLDYIATETLSDAGADFDLAFSHEAIYLIENLADHARQVASVLKPGGCYDAVTCCHAQNPFWPKWRDKIAEFSNIPVPNHSVGDFVDAFRAAGLDVSVSRFLASSKIPMAPNSDYFPTHVDRIDVYTQWKLNFRCVRR